MRKGTALQKKISAAPIPPLPDLLSSDSFDIPHQLLTALFESDTIGFGVIDRHLRFRAANEALAAMHGLPSKAILGKTLREVMGNAAKAIEPVVRRGFITGQFSSAWRICSLLGNKQPMILDRFPLKRKDGRVEEVAYLAARIPERGKWEQRLSGGLAFHEQSPEKGPKVTKSEHLPTIAVSAALFQGLESAEVDSILNAARIRRVMSGEYLCRQGETPDKLYLVRTGLIKVNSTTDRGKEVLLRWVRPGEVFGLATLTKPSLLNAWSARAAESSEALEWDRMAIQRLSSLYPAFWPNALWIALHWAHELQTRVEQMSTERVEQRLARALTDFSKQVKSTNQGIELKVTGEELAQMVGTTLFTISKVFNRWKRLGYVSKGRKRVFILDRKRLSQVAEGLIKSGAGIPERYPQRPNVLVARGQVQ